MAANEAMKKRTMAFIRRFDGRMFGGHLKFFDYARHVAASELYRPALYVTPGSTPLADETVGFTIPRISSLRDADAYFVAGLDWRVLIANGIDPSVKPVVNLIQGFIHTQRDDPRSTFLSLPALRICVSDALHDALAATGRVGGPLVSIENATDVPLLRDKSVAESKIFIAGMKSPALSQALALALSERSVDVDLQIEPIPREAFLERLRAATIAVLLPLEHDGFFLPAIEAMALGCAVVVPRIEGARSYCIDGETALVPRYDVESLLAATMRLHEDRGERTRLSANGLERAALHSPQRERELFIAALSSYTEGWR